MAAKTARKTKRRPVKATTSAMLRRKVVPMARLPFSIQKRKMQATSRVTDPKAGSTNIGSAAGRHAIATIPPGVMGGKSQPN